MKKNNLTINTSVNLSLATQGNLEEYISFVQNIPLLSDVEEYDLAKKWQDEGDIEAARYLVLSHLRLVVSIARGYSGYGLPLADLIQEGTVGLMKAVKRFDVYRNNRLVTVANYWIKAEINEYIVKNWRIVKTVTTKEQRKLFFNLRSNRDDVGNLSDIEAKKIAKQLEVSHGSVVDMNMRLTSSDVSLMSDNSEIYAPIQWLQDDSLTPEYIINKKLTDKLHTEGIQLALNKLDDRSKDIIFSRWLLDEKKQLTLMDLAQKYNISIERVRQIEVKALQTMRDSLQNYG